MPPSYRLVNFRLRPAKAVERRMIIEACGRMAGFASILDFRYIGLGSPFFNDFVLMHRRYGLRNMICIEREVQHKDRFLFNRPFDCISMEWGTSTEVLPTLSWRDIPTIVWMDYDGRISEEMLSDLRTIFSQIETGSLALFTIQADGNSFKTDEQSSLERFQEEMRDFVPIDATRRDMQGKAFQRMLWRIVNNEISRILDQRNVAMPASNHIQYRQLFNVIYADDARMTTIGGVIYRADQTQHLAACKFDDMNFVRRDDEPLEIIVPTLTHREQWKLDTLLPSSGPELEFLAEGDVTNYSQIYRYYPTFVETDL